MTERMHLATQYSAYAPEHLTSCDVDGLDVLKTVKLMLVSEHGTVPLTTPMSASAATQMTDLAPIALLA